MQRVIAYIDGFNLYFGLRSKHWQRFYWLNLQRVVQLLLKPHQELVQTKYFTSLVKSPPAKNRRQTTYLEALRTLDHFAIFEGHFLEAQVICSHCGHTYTTHHEKMTDVNIAVELLTDAFHDAYDTALLISADSDLVGPIYAVKSLFPAKRVVVIFPPARHSAALKVAAHAYTHLGRNVLTESLFPDPVIKPDGFALQCPANWK
jgi:uncharacterized LabA/DUF88 family protein